LSIRENLGHSDEGRFAGESTSVGANQKISISIVSPPSSPRVSDVVSLNISICVGQETGDLDAMIDVVGAAAVGLQDLVVAGISFEAGGVEADGERAARLQIGQHGVLIVLANEVVACNSGNFVAAVLALTIHCGVGIGRIRFESSDILNILVSRGRVSSVATTIVGIAVDDLLGRQSRGQGAVGLGVIGLDLFGGGEGPTGAAFLLILDRRNESVVAPIVEGVGEATAGGLGGQDDGRRREPGRRGAARPSSLIVRESGEDGSATRIGHADGHGDGHRVVREFGGVAADRVQDVVLHEISIGKLVLAHVRERGEAVRPRAVDLIARARALDRHHEVRVAAILFVGGGVILAEIGLPFLEELWVILAVDRQSRRKRRQNGAEANGEGDEENEEDEGSHQ
jgi:hypothetical protein